MSLTLNFADYSAFFYGTSTIVCVVITLVQGYHNERQSLFTTQLKRVGKKLLALQDTTISGVIRCTELMTGVIFRGRKKCCMSVGCSFIKVLSTFYLPKLVLIFPTFTDVMSLPKVIHHSLQY